MKPIEMLETYLSGKTDEEKLQVWHAFRLLMERDDLYDKYNGLVKDLETTVQQLTVVNSKIEALK